MSNLILVQLQQPGASFTVGGGGGPNWNALNAAQFGQGLVEFSINEGYRKTLGDLEDLALVLVSFTLTSTVRTYKYSVPPASYSNISHVARVFYQPFGLPYTQEFEPGVDFISWSDFQYYTAQGYLEPYSFGTQPDKASIDPLLTSLYFYPGSANAGDTITVYYSPIPSNTTGCPILTTANQAPLLPIDTHMAIVYYALSILWIRAREMGAAKYFITLYQSELKMIREKYTKKHHGDSFKIKPFGMPVHIGDGI